MRKETLKVFNELIETIEKSSTNNEAVITNVKLWAETWKKEMELAVGCNSDSEQLKAFADFIQSDTSHINYDFKDLVQEYLDNL